VHPCFYIQHAAARQDVCSLNLASDPPPDLVIEIDITRPSLNKLPLYAAIGVLEVWRYTREGMRLYQLRDDGCEPRESSGVLPGISRADLDQCREMPNRTAWFKHVVAHVQARDTD
jgi:Uma2 family endonuclease